MDSNGFGREDTENPNNENAKEKDTASDEQNVQINSIQVNDSVAFQHGGTEKEGLVRYVGTIGEEEYAGIVLTGPSVGLGDSDGSFMGKPYFTCPAKHGIFCPLKDVKKRPLSKLESLRLRREHSSLLASEQRGYLELKAAMSKELDMRLEQKLAEFKDIHQRLAKLEANFIMDEQLKPEREQSEKSIIDRLSKLEEHNANEEDLEEESHKYYTPDTYSLLSNYGPKENLLIFIYSILVFLFQIALALSLVFSIVIPAWRSNDVVDGTNQIFPADVEPIVKVVQVLSIIVYTVFADYSMQDLIIACNFFFSIKGALTDTKRVGKLFLSAFLRLLQSVAVIVATFILIFTSLTATDVVLNFAAVNFISSLDDVAFDLVATGFFGRRTKDKALEIKDKRLPDCILPSDFPIRGSWAVIFLVGVVMTAIGVNFIVVPQSQGEFLYDTFRIEFDDETGFTEYSGCYHYETSSLRFDGRPIYRLDTEKEASFGYCKEMQRWYLFDSSKSGYEDACTAAKNRGEGLLIYSSKTHGFDIEEIFSDPWFSSGHTPLDATFYIEGPGISDGCGKKIGDGRCDMELNTDEFSYDGGDCCASTCNHPDCGLGAIDIAFGTDISSLGGGDGYQNCLDPSTESIEILFHSINLRYTDQPFYLRVECDGVTHLALYIVNQMVSKTETIHVSDGSSCNVGVTTSIFSRIYNEIEYTSYTIYHNKGDGVNDTIIMEDHIFPYNDSSLDKPSAFQLIPRCFINKLRDYIDIEKIYAKERTLQSMVITDYLMDETLTSECESPFFIERYALAVTLLSAKISHKDITNLSSIANVLPEEMKEEKNYCSWSFVQCKSGLVTKIMARNYMEGKLATEISLLSELKELFLGTFDLISYLIRSN